MEQVINTPLNEVSARAYLTENGWPAGLQDSIINTMRRIPIRYYIIDNSGSMETEDGWVVRDIPSEDETEYM